MAWKIEFDPAGQKELEFLGERVAKLQNSTIRDRSEQGFKAL
jgi:hypothetical protein